MNEQKLIGIHIKFNTKKSTTTDIDSALTYAKDIGCTHVQMFNENLSNLEDVKKILHKLKLEVVIHSPYTINLASGYNNESWRVKYLMTEIIDAMDVGAIGLVVHMGKSMDLSIKDAYNNMYNSLEHACRKIGNRKFDIYLETTAGQGTELCYKLEDLGEFFKRVKNNKNMTHIKICLDTCHIFAAGYDIRTKKLVDEFIAKFDDLVGVERVGLMHVNDSIYDFDSHKDRHSNLGEGFIGLEGIRHFYKYFSKKNIPGILETPITNFQMEIKKLD